MDFWAEIRAIHNNWMYERISKATAIIEFENLIRSHGLLPENQQVDRSISDETFVSLLNQAAAISPTALAMAQKQAAESSPSALAKAFQCSSCKNYVPHLFVEAQIRDDAGKLTDEIKLDAPLCEDCVRELIAKRLTAAHQRLGQSFDDSGVTPMSLSERGFFRLYEEQMKESEK